MHVIGHGKVSYALGLKWTETEGGDPQAHLRDIVGSPRFAFHSFGKRREKQMVGYTTNLEPFTGKKTKSIVSLVAAVHALNQDGAYVLDLDDGRAWLCVIHNGKVMPTPDGAESILETDRAYAAATRICRSIDVTLRASRPMDGAEPFSLDMLSGRGKKLATMRVAKSANNLVGGVVLAAVVAGIGYGAWATFADSTPKGTSAEALAQQERQSYVNSISGSIPQMDQDAEWVLDAFDMAMSSFPALIEGWALTKVACDPSMCTGVYEVEKRASVYSFDGLTQRFGKHRVRLVEGQEEVNISLERASATRSWGEEEILDPVIHPINLVDLHGLLRVRVPQVKVEPGFNSAEINVGPRPVLVRALMREAIVTHNDFRASGATIGAQVDVMRDAGFVPTALLMNHGNAANSAWRIEWVRINGAAA